MDGDGNTALHVLVGGMGMETPSSRHTAAAIALLRSGARLNVKNAAGVSAGAMMGSVTIPGSAQAIQEYGVKSAPDGFNPTTGACVRACVRACVCVCGHEA